VVALLLAAVFPTVDALSPPAPLPALLLAAELPTVDALSQPVPLHALLPMPASARSLMAAPAPNALADSTVALFSARLRLLKTVLSLVVDASKLPLGKALPLAHAPLLAAESPTVDALSPPAPLLALLPAAEFPTVDALNPHVPLLAAVKDALLAVDSV